MNKVVILNNEKKAVVTLNQNKYGKPNTTSPDNFVSLTKKAQEAAEIARKSADKVLNVVNNLQVGNVVSSVKEENGNVIVAKVNGDTNSFKVVKTVNGVASDDLGNIELPNQIIVKFLD